MRDHFDWHDLKLFLDVARSGGLSAASVISGTSPATLNRRMNSLEETMGQRIFVRGGQGYELTEVGKQLFSHAQNVEMAILGIKRWQEGQGARRFIRISAGNWMSWFLARNMDRLSTSQDNWSFDLMSATETVDIGHRQADLGIRNRRPAERWLAIRQLGHVAFAVYRKRIDGASSADVDPQSILDTGNWVGIVGNAAIAPSAQWTNENHGARTSIRTSDVRVVPDLMSCSNGMRLAVLPCFVGDQDTALERVGGTIDELGHEQWLVMHQDERHHPDFREAIDRISTLVMENQRLFKGEIPKPDDKES